MPEFVEIDGSIGEGGGQVLRTSFALAALQGKPIKISNIRASRPKPGLSPQHLTALQTLSSICGAGIEGALRGSESVSFIPGEIKDSQLAINIGTAGSISLLLQQLLPAALKSKSRIRIVGGTNVDWSPPIEFMQHLFFPLLKKMGAKFNLSVSKRGYYPKGRGIVTFLSSKAKLPLKPINLDEFQGLQGVSVFSHSSNLPREVSVNQAKSAENLIRAEFPDAIFAETIESKNPSDTIGSGITLIASDAGRNKLSGSALGRRGKPAEQVGKEAAEKLLAHIKQGKAVDSFTADQLIPFMALAKGYSTIHCSRLSQHCLTNITVCEKLLGVKFGVKGLIGKQAEISVEGTAFT